MNSRVEPSAAELQNELERRMLLYRHDPLGHVLYSYPWGRGDLAHFPGPRKWQREVLDYIGQQLRQPGGAKKPIRVAVRSGNGPGKTALIAFISNWALSTFPDTRINLTAETDTQLKTKTWPEISKWFNRLICSHWFQIAETSIKSLDPRHSNNWKMDRVTWSAETPEGYAGLHNARKRLLLIMDEASAIPDIIFDTSEGAWTDADTEIICLVFGNPTRNTGYFHAIFNELKYLWKTWEIDIRTVEGINPEQIREWENHPSKGIGTDWFRVHIEGKEPLTSDLQYISRALVDQALRNNVTVSQYQFAPKIIGVDSAWWGGDEIAIVLRQGLMCLLLGTLPKNDDDTILGGRLAALEDEHKADAVFIDQAYGTGVYSYGKMIGRKWQLISFAESPTDPYYENKRMEMYAEAKQWLKDGGCLPDKQMATELTYGEAFINRKGKLQYESKDDMKARGLPSPGRSDALCLTFSRRVKPKADHMVGGIPHNLRLKARRDARKKAYEPLAY